MEYRVVILVQRVARLGLYSGSIHLQVNMVQAGSKDKDVVNMSAVNPFKFLLFFILFLFASLFFHSFPRKGRRFCHQHNDFETVSYLFYAQETYQFKHQCDQFNVPSNHAYFVI